MAASNQFTPSERVLRANLAAHSRWAKTPDQATATAAPRPDPWLIVDFPARALGLSTWDDVLATVLTSERRSDVGSEQTEAA